MYSNCVMSFVLYPTKSEYYNILQKQTEQFKCSLYQCLSHSLSLVILEKLCIYSYVFWADPKSVSVIIVNRRKTKRLNAGYSAVVIDHPKSLMSSLNSAKTQPLGIKAMKKGCVFAEFKLLIKHFGWSITTAE